jgi:hypothetical protein
VAFPFHINASSPKYSSPQSQVFQQSFDSAIDMFRIREIQSEWYMDLFHSGREPWQDPYPYIWKQYARMSDWFNDMPQSTLPAIRSFFELELLYSYVYILSPSPRIPHIHEYAQRLIFEHCIAYATNLLTLLNKPSNTTKPPVTFYDAMRAYMTGRQFVDVLTRNMDMILDPRPPSPPVPTASQLDSEDPLAPPAQISPPPFPTPLLPANQMTPLDPTTRAIAALNDFTSVLSNFGLRFGFTHWRDRFQRESSALNAALYQRNTTSPHSSPPQNQYPPQWIPLPSPQPPQLVYGHPTTPPSLFPPPPGSQGQMPSPFSSSLSYNTASPYETGNATSPGVWGGTPSPQAMPDMPMPTEGRKRQALVYGGGVSPGAGDGPSAGWVPPQQDGNVNGNSGNGSWIPPPPQQQQQQDASASGWAQQQQDGSGGWTQQGQGDAGNWGQGGNGQGWQ